jgi:hypothetical protein
MYRDKRAGTQSRAAPRSPGQADEKAHREAGKNKGAKLPMLAK